MIIFFNLACKLSAIIKNIKENWLFTLILSFGIGMRFIPINQYQFSHDELSGLSRTIFPTLSQEINYGVMALDTHPSLIQLFLWYWTKLFGYNEIAVKLPFLMCGVLATYFIYRFCKTFFDIKSALISATIVSLSFIFLVYSSYARMYIPGVLFSVLLLNVVFKIVFSPTVTIKDYIFFSLMAVLCAYNHHMSCLFAVTVSFFALFYLPKQRFLKFLLFCLIVIALYLPHLSITLYQFSIGGVGASGGGWLSAPRTNEIYFFIKTLLGCGITGKINMILFFGMIIISIFSLIPITRKQLFLLWVFLTNYLIIHLYSVYRNPILQYSVLLFAGIALIIFLSSFSSWLSKKQSYAFVILLILGFSFQSFRKKHVFSKVHVQDFEMQVKTTLDARKNFGKQNVTSIFGCEKFFVHVYEKKFHEKLNYISVEDSIYQKPDRLRQYLSKLKQPYIIVAGLSPLEITIIKEYYPNLVSHEENYFSNVTVLSKRFSKNVDVSVLNTMPLFNSDMELYVDKRSPVIFYGDSMLYPMNYRTKEFPFGVKIPIQRSLLKENQFLVAELIYDIDSLSNVSKDQLCLSIKDKNNKNVFYTSSKLKDYLNKTKTQQRVYVSLFAGAEFGKWFKQNLNIEFFIWKQKNSQYNISNFKLHVMDYNPTKWTLWN